MKSMKLPDNVSRKLYKILFKTKKHSPEMLLAAGVVGVVTSTVMACKATTKIDSVLDKHKTNIKKTKDYVAESGFTNEYTEKDYKKDLTIMYTQTGLKLVKLYAPAVVMGTVSITAILAGHNVLRKRNAALTDRKSVV